MIVHKQGNFFKKKMSLSLRLVNNIHSDTLTNACVYAQSHKMGF